MSIKVKRCKMKTNHRKGSNQEMVAGIEPK